MEILNKYEPTNIKDVIGNKIQIKRILEFLRNESNEQRILGILGPNGCGKSLISRLALKEINSNVLEISKYKDISNTISNFCIHKTIDAFFKPQRKIILIDNLETFLLQDKHFIASILSSLDVVKSKKMFIVFTCNFSSKSNDEKKLLDFKKEAEIIKINYPSIKDAFVYVNDIITEREKIEGITDEMVLKLANQHRGSIRDMVLSLKDSNESFEETRRINQFKDMNTFEVAKKIFASSRSLELKDIESITHDNILGFLLYENAPDELHGNYELNIDDYIKINEQFIISSHIEDYTFKSNEWSLYQLVQTIRIMCLVMPLKTLEKKKAFKDLKYRFSQLLSKISHKNIMSKKIDSNLEIGEVLGIVDWIIKNDKDVKSRKKNMASMTADFLNYVNTYEKYFIGDK